VPTGADGLLQNRVSCWGPDLLLVENVLMAKGYRPVVRDQQFLVPPDMREWLPADHSVWTLIGIVEGLDTSAFHQGRRTGGVGRAGYDPDMLVTLLIWAWSQGVRSSRRIERSCADVVSYRVICAGDAPDHVTIARFRAENHGACEQLFGQVLMLAARLGLGRLETVALDGVKIASNASMAANRSTSGLAKAAEAEAARIAAAVVAEHAATDAEEDELFGEDNPGSVPAELADPAVLAARIAEELARLDGERTVEPDADPVRVGDQDQGEDFQTTNASCPDCEDSAAAVSPMLGPTESVAPQVVPRDRLGRISQAQALLEAAAVAARARQAAAAQPYLARLSAGEKFAGPVPVAARVALLEQRLAERIAECEAKHQRWQANRGTVSPGRRPVPVERNAKILELRAALSKARAAQDALRQALDVEQTTVNLTDPQSRIQPLRGGGWLQGYNCQAVTTADGLIVATGVGTSPVDNQYYRAMIDKTITAADLITGHRPPSDTSDQAAAESIGMVLADAGYCTNENLTAPGPDRLIATGKARDVHNAATNQPAEGPPPEHLDPIEAMAHRLRTPEGITQYAKRSHIAETPFGHAKHNLGFRRFTGRGVARARSEWTFHAAVHNIGKIIGHLAGAPLPV
jgi:transposase